MARDAGARCGRSTVSLLGFSPPASRSQAERTAFIAAPLAVVAVLAPVLLSPETFGLPDQAFDAFDPDESHRAIISRFLALASAEK